MKNQVVTPNPTVVYSSMWTKLKAHVGDYAPQTLVTDMEVASGPRAVLLLSPEEVPQGAHRRGARPCRAVGACLLQPLPDGDQPLLHPRRQLGAGEGFPGSHGFPRSWRVCWSRPWSRRRAVSLLPPWVSSTTLWTPTWQKAVRKKLDALKRVMVKYYEFEGHEGVSEYLKLISAILS